MAMSAGTMLDMAKKKPGRPKRSPAYTLYARIDLKVGEALEAYLQSLELKPTTAAVVELALKRYLVEEGFFPGRSQDEGK
jgi:hypothetical protein